MKRSHVKNFAVETNCCTSGHNNMYMDRLMHRGARSARLVRSMNYRKVPFGDINPVFYLYWFTGNESLIGEFLPLLGLMFLKKY